MHPWFCRRIESFIFTNRINSDHRNQSVMGLNIDREGFRGSITGLEVGVDGSEGRVQVWGFEAIVGAASFLLGLLSVKVSEAGIVSCVEGISPFCMIRAPRPLFTCQNDFFRIEHSKRFPANWIYSLTIKLYNYCGFKISSDGIRKKVELATISILIKSNYLSLSNRICIAKI